MKILGICGSLQALSANLALLHVAAQSTPADAEFVVFDGLRDLPLFNPDVEAAGAPKACCDGDVHWRRATAYSSPPRSTR